MKLIPSVTWDQYQFCDYCGKPLIELKQKRYDGYSPMTGEKLYIEDDIKVCPNKNKFFTICKEFHSELVRTKPLEELH